MQIVPVFSLDALESIGIDYSNFNGISIYKGVIIAWDEDTDPRMFSVIDYLPKPIRKRLLVVYEHKGRMVLLWNGKIPDEWLRHERNQIPSKDTAGNPNEWFCPESHSIFEIYPNISDHAFK